MAEKQQLSDKQLLEVRTTDSLSLEQIARRTVLLQMQTQEVSLDKAAVENEKYVAEREQAQRQWKARCADIKASEAEQQRIEALCAHNTGGQDRKGFYAGDGDIYGACISKQVLPSGEAYALCFRCGKEWHHPSWTMKYYPGHGSELMSGIAAVIAGAKPVSEYFAEESEWHKAMHAKAKTFETTTGELPTSIAFSIPLLEARRAKEKAEFQEFLTKLPPKELAAAKVQAMGIQ